MTKNYFFLLLLIVFASMACKRKPIQQTTTKTISTALSIKNNDFNYFVGKAKVNFNSPEQNMSFQANIRIKKDSLIWISVSPGLGIEVARCLFNQQNVFVIDKFNKKNYEMSYDSLSRQFNFPINFHLFQSLLVGNTVFEPEQAIKIEKDSSFYILHHKEGEVVLQQFIQQLSQRIEKLEAIEKTSKTSLQVIHQEFEPKELNVFPKKSYIQVTSEKAGNTTISTQFIRIETPIISPDFSF